MFFFYYVMYNYERRCFTGREIKKYEMSSNMFALLFQSQIY